MGSSSILGVYHFINFHGIIYIKVRFVRDTTSTIPLVIPKAGLVPNHRKHSVNIVTPLAYYKPVLFFDLVRIVFSTLKEYSVILTTSFYGMNQKI